MIVSRTSFGPRWTQRYIQLNLENSKFSVQEFFFRITSSSNHMEVDIEIDNPKMMFIIFCSLSKISLGHTENIHVCYDSTIFHKLTKLTSV